MPRGVYERKKTSASSKGRPRLSTAPVQKVASPEKTAPIPTPAEMNPAPKVRRQVGRPKTESLGKQYVESLSTREQLPVGPDSWQKFNALQSHLTCLVTNHTTLQTGSTNTPTEVERVLQSEIIATIQTMAWLRIDVFGARDVPEHLVARDYQVMAKSAAPTPGGLKPFQVGLPHETIPLAQAPFQPIQS